MLKFKGKGWTNNGFFIFEFSNDCKGFLNLLNKFIKFLKRFKYIKMWKFDGIFINKFFKNFETLKKF